MDVFLELMPFFLVRNGTIQMTVNKDAEEVRSRLFRDFFQSLIETFFQLGDASPGPSVSKYFKIRLIAI